MEKLTRVIDGGGYGFRRADVCNNQVKNLTISGLVGNVNELLDFVCAGLTGKIRGIAYAMAGEIKGHNIVVQSPHIHMLDGIALGDLTEKVSGKPTLVFHDVASAAVGVSRLCPHLKSFIMLNFGSGIGLRVFDNGVLSAEGEGGHLPLESSSFSPRCDCGLRGCAESICGGEATKRQVLAETKELGIQIPDGMHPCAFLDREFDEGKNWARNIYNVVAVGMGRYLAILQSIFHLPTIVWKGNFAKHALPRIEGKVREIMRSCLPKVNPVDLTWEDKTKFIFSPDPEKDSLIGGVALFNQIHK